jgi:hypothetical protein
MVAFNQACDDHRLTAPETAHNISPEDRRLGISTDSLAEDLDKLIPTMLRDIRACFETGVARIKQIRNNSGKLVPVHKLPNELLSTVFLLARGPQGAALFFYARSFRPEVASDSRWD